jgi:hypothetical protein
VPPEPNQDPVADGTRCPADVLGVDPTELAERMGVDASLTIGAGLLQVTVDTRDYCIGMSHPRWISSCEPQTSTSAQS